MKKQSIKQVYGCFFFFLYKSFQKVLFKPGLIVSHLFSSIYPVQGSAVVGQEAGYTLEYIAVQQ